MSISNECWLEILEDKDAANKLLLDVIDENNTRIAELEAAMKPFASIRAATWAEAKKKAKDAIRAGVIVAEFSPPATSSEQNLTLLGAMDRIEKMEPDE